jgi:hypothetical protein
MTPVNALLALCEDAINPDNCLHTGPWPRTPTRTGILAVELAGKRAVPTATADEQAVRMCRMFSGCWFAVARLPPG